jgi:GNAT superfamily N-acetyltransferase
MEIVITWYNDTMQDQVISMFENEYKLNRQYFNTLFNNFYFHPFQKNKCILIVALDGDTVAGFQSFFYWPYTFSGKTFNSFQSGNSLVHPNYRGKGIFQKMLAFIDKENKTIGIDLLMGFPVEASLRNFIKDSWKNIFDLRWYLKIGNPLAFFDSAIESKKGFDKGLICLENFNDKKLRLSTDASFTSWRKNYLSGNAYFSFTYRKDSETIIFHLKKNKRKKVLNELIIGSVLLSSKNAERLLKDALKELISGVRMSFHFISMAINESGDQFIKQNLENLKFKRTDKSVYFIVKPFSDNNIALEPFNWIIYRADIDTW